MSNINIKIDWCDTNYCACVEDDDIACVATGKTLSEVKQNMKDALILHLEGMKEDGEEIPAIFQQPEFSFHYHLTARAMLKHSDLFISRKALAKETGINEQQLCHYANGYRNARPATTQKIAAGIRAIGNDLTHIQ